MVPAPCLPQSAKVTAFMNKMHIVLFFAQLSFYEILGLNWETDLFHSAKLRLSTKINDEYKDCKQLPAVLQSQQGPVGPVRPGQSSRKMIEGPARLYSSLCFRGEH